MPGRPFPMGVSDYLLKPVSAANLLAAVGRVRDAIERAGAPFPSGAGHGAAGGVFQQPVQRLPLLGLPDSGTGGGAVHPAGGAGLSGGGGQSGSAGDGASGALEPCCIRHRKRWPPASAGSGWSTCCRGRIGRHWTRRKPSLPVGRGLRQAVRRRLTLVKGGVVQRLGELSKSYQTASLRRENRRNGSEEQLIEAKPFDREELLEFLRIGRGETPGPSGRIIALPLKEPSLPTYTAAIC